MVKVEGVMVILAETPLEEGMPLEEGVEKDLAVYEEVVENEGVKVALKGLVVAPVTETVVVRLQYTTQGILVLRLRH